MTKHFPVESLIGERNIARQITYTQFDNRFDNRLYGVYKHSTGCHNRLYRVNGA